VVSARGAKPRGWVNFLRPTSNIVPLPLLPSGEACSTKIVWDVACLNSYSRSVQSKGTTTGVYLAHPSIKAKAKAGKQVHNSFSLKLVTLTYLLILSSLSDALPRHPIFHISSNGGSGNEAPNGRVTEGCHCSSPLLCDAVMGRGGQLGDDTTGEPNPTSGYLQWWWRGADCDRTTQFIQVQVRLSPFNRLTRTYSHLYKPDSPPSVTKDLGKLTSQPRP
jgi:hypothetical protein